MLITMGKGNKDAWEEKIMYDDIEMALGRMKDLRY